jgi:hypothetical protein
MKYSVSPITITSDAPRAFCKLGGNYLHYRINEALDLVSYISNVTNARVNFLIFNRKFE